MSDLLNMNLTQILEEGMKGNLPNMTEGDWMVLEFLVEKSGKTQYSMGERSGFKKGVRYDRGESFNED